MNMLVSNYVNSSKSMHAVSRILSSVVPQRPAPQHRPYALPKDRLVESVPPTRAHLRQHEALLVREVLEEARKKRWVQPEFVKHHKPEK